MAAARIAPQDQAVAHRRGEDVEVAVVVHVGDGERVDGRRGVDESRPDAARELHRDDRPRPVRVHADRLNGVRPPRMTERGVRP